MTDLKNLNSLPLDVQKKISPYFKKLLALYPGQICSVVIYGSATGKNYIPKVSDINSVIVFKEMDFSILNRALKVVSDGIRQKIAAPLFLTSEYIERSLDVFPVEFLDIKENHVLICGEDIFSSLNITGEHLRLFCEQQIKGKLIRIRQAYLEVGLRRKGIEALLKESLNSLIPIFRNLIRLKGKSPDIDKTHIITELCQEFGLDKEVFLPIFRDKSNDEKIANQDVEVFLSKYMDELQRLARAVDQL